MTSMMKPLVAALVLGAAGLTCFGRPADAACGLPGAMKPSAWQYPENAPSAPAYLLRSAVYRPESDSGAFRLTGDDGAWRAGIVGMWRVTFSVAGPNGSAIVIDDGYSQWHGDGTEIMNSGAHAPLTSNFCLGVWKQVGPNKFKLNHFPLAWDAAGTAPQGPVHITATVTLTDDDHFTGSFTLNAYNWDGSSIVNAEGPPFATATGTITGTRVTTETKVPGT